MKHPLILAAAAAAGLLALAACNQADTASRNLSLAADNFEIVRRVSFYNSWTDTFLLQIEGRCSLGNQDKAGQLTVTCKDGEGDFKKHFLGLSDSVTYFVEQIAAADVSTYHSRVIFRPQTLIPDVQLDVNTRELTKDRY